MNIFKSVATRTIALIILKVSGTLAAGSIFGIEIWAAAAMAAFVGIMEVAEDLSRAYVVDGNLTEDEINTAFSTYAEAQPDNER